MNEFIEEFNAWGNLPMNNWMAFNIWCLVFAIFIRGK